MQQHLLTLLVLVPVVGALVAILYSLAPGGREENYKWIAFLTSLATFVFSLLLIQGAGGGTADFRTLQPPQHRATVRMPMHTLERR